VHRSHRLAPDARTRASVDGHEQQPRPLCRAGGVDLALPPERRDRQRRGGRDLDVRRAMMRGGGCALVAFTFASWMAPATADSSLWEEVARPYRRQCAQLLDEAGKLLNETARTRGPADTQKALASLRRSVELCSGDREVEQRAGELLLSAREFAEGRRHLETARVLADAAPPSP